MSALDAACPACGASLVTEQTYVGGHKQLEAEVLDGKWAIERKLGQGGMGTVYLARDLELERRVAIKMMAGELASNPDVVARFEREARMMARLDHPNLVPIYAVGRKGQVPFIVMKFLEGAPLNDYLLTHGRLEMSAALPLVKQACAGLQFIHQRGVVHRDVKPANIFVAPDGHVTLLDLGVAHDAQSTMTRSGVMVGTPRYMAPEQILARKVDFRADLYALATVVFEMLTGKAVFDANSDFSVMKAHIDEAPPDPLALAPLPSGVSPVLLRGLAKSPEDRFESVMAFYEALEAGSHSPVTQRTPGPRSGTNLQPLAVTPAPRGARQATPSPKATDQMPPVAGAERPSGPVTRTAADLPQPDEEPIELPKNPLRAYVAGGVGLLLVGGLVGVAIAMFNRPDEGLAKPIDVPPEHQVAAADPPANPVKPEPAKPDPTAPSTPVATPTVATPTKPTTPTTPATATTPTTPTSPAGTDDPGGGSVTGSPADPARPTRPAVAPANALAERRPIEPKAVEPRKQPKRPVEPRQVSRPEPAVRPDPVVEDKPASVNLVTIAAGEPASAYVDVDGIRKGATPIRVTLEPGQHELTFRREGFKTVTRRITIGPGEAQKLKVELTP